MASPRATVVCGAGDANDAVNVTGVRRYARSAWRRLPTTSVTSTKTVWSPVGADAEMPIADPPAQARGIVRHRVGDAINIDVVVADAVHLGEA